MRLKHSSHSFNTSHIRNMLLALLVAVATIFAAAPAAHADGRDWLRPGCTWAPQGHWIQACEVWSPAHNRNMLVFIQAATNGGNGGLYLLDGAQVGERDSNWASVSTAPATFENDNITLVMPAGGAGEFYADWGGVANDFMSSGQERPMWETFLAYELPGYLQQHFGVDPHRNAIAGVSMGAIPALTLSAHHPDQFRQAHALSGFIDPAMATHVGMIAGFSIASLLHSGKFLWEWFTINPLEFPGRILHADPVANVHKLRDGGVDVHVWSGNSHPGAGESYPGWLGADAISIHGETLITLSTNSFTDKARHQGLNVHRHYGAGLHTWQPWGRYMADHKGDVLWAIG
ncbi:alpha/beta hydrolase [Corynebacterium epidermidicanis]|uniref:Putative esterase n=1 Tax=Corynebacterium epidermidicanis TaxID=1050174 RepID=A0A0G3GLJ8_9CORY|nr:alpha/beta hydrolase family protein [Corynebacterium epidermidicanis]AKK02044.1 putative esterase [Corynebacterium epidermidicanis]